MINKNLLTKLYLLFLSLVLSISIFPVWSEEKEIKVVYTTRALTPEAALKVSQAALNSCRKSGLQVSVAVVDNGGNVQVVLRDKLAGITSPEAAVLKAKTTINFRSATSSLSKAVNSNSEASGIKQLPGILVLGGAVPVFAAGSMVGAVGVAGAPDGDKDEKCALAGIAVIQELLDFVD